MSRSIRGLLGGMVCLVVVGCGPTGYSVWQTQYTTVEITGIETGEPIAGAEVLVARLWEEYGGRLHAPKVFTPAEPPDELGVLRVPITLFTVEGWDYPGRLRFSIQAADAMETIEVSNTEEAIGAGLQYQVRIVETGGEPEPLTLCVDYSEDPPLLHVNGYVDSVRVCRPDLDGDTWVLEAESELAYISSLPLESDRHDVAPLEGFDLTGGLAGWCRVPDDLEVPEDASMYVLIDTVIYGASFVIAGECGE
jgi:hypothetical protein